ncbi:MAG TPA: extracellular solute-binding protein [Alphaproteobacteria bacterium]|nr:extracellular solute-binding protein [Alphaproteobacteria bacterium]
MFALPVRTMSAAVAFGALLASTFAVPQLRAEMAVAAPAASAPAPVHALAMHGAPKYGADFTHLEYTNPDAPKGGELRMASFGTFDTLNPFTLRGVAAPGLGMTFQTLLTNTDDEAFTEYGQIAESIEMPEDRSFVTFNLRKEARFHDGKPLTAADVVWTFQTLMEKGHPFYRSYYGNVKEAKAETPQRVTFVFNMAGNRELPLIMGQMPVLPKHAFEGKDFSATVLTAVTGSGPYKVKSIDAGRRIVYERVKDWWAKDLPINRGQYNFDTISYEMFRDETVLLQAFFAGAYDVRQENIAKSWESEYKGQRPVQKGLIRKEEIPHSLPAGMQAFAFNTRRAVFADPQVRAALNYAFDFEWSNRQFAYGTYTRTGSYFANSELASSGLPQGRELEILEAFRGKVPEEVFTQAYKNPVTSGSGNDMRTHLAKARAMLEAAGWKMGKKSQLLEKDGQVFRFEFLLHSEAFARWINPMIGNLKRLGIDATLRVVDTAQYQKRMDDFDFDVTIGSFPQSLSPGNEQRDFWGADKADLNGSRNIIGIKNQVVDALIEQIVAAPDREELIARTRALDRVLLWNHYVIPQWHTSYHRVAYWDKFGHPATPPKYGLGIVGTWWYDAQKDAALKKRESEAGGKK